jgi:hypothetical protein
MEMLLVVLGGFLLAAGLYALEAYFFMLLFNVVAHHFGVPEVTFWVSAAIVALVNTLKPSSSPKTKGSN